MSDDDLHEPHYDLLGRLLPPCDRAGQDHEHVWMRHGPDARPFWGCDCGLQSTLDPAGSEYVDQEIWRRLRP